MIKKDNIIPISNNVIVFPKRNFNSEIKNTTLEEVQENINMARQYHIQGAIEDIAPLIFNQLEVSGFSFSSMEEEDSLKDGAFLVESLRSMMCKYYGIYHPFQQISDNIFIPDEKEEGALRIVDNINLTLKKDKQ
jgi:hypothetical protein